MKKNKIVFFLITCVITAVLTGCSKKEAQVAAEVVEEVNMFGLTDEEQKLYAEYAAGVLMKYNAGTNNRVLDGQKLIQQEAKEEAQREQAAKREQLAAEYEANKNSSKKDKGNSSSNGTSGASGTSVSYISDMAQATGMNAFSIVYSGYEVADSYPNVGDDVLMAMDATNGKLLLVTKYRVTNTSGQTENLNMFSKQAKFVLYLNGKRYKSQYTLLLDDLSMYKGELEAGETIEGVLIFEIPESEATSMEDMVLSIMVDGESSSMQLRGGSTDVWTEDVEVSEDEVESVDNVFDDVENEVGEESDLAQEYMEALEALETENNSEEIENSSSGNITVVGSQRN